MNGPLNYYRTTHLRFDEEHSEHVSWTITDLDSLGNRIRRWSPSPGPSFRCARDTDRWEGGSDVKSSSTWDEQDAHSPYSDRGHREGWALDNGSEQRLCDRDCGPLPAKRQAERHADKVVRQAVCNIGTLFSPTDYYASFHRFVQ